MRRVFWKMMLPLFWIYARKMGGGYKYYNRCIAAWNPKLFTAIDQNAWFGTPVSEIPCFVVLCGIGYDVEQYEGLVKFTESGGIYGTVTELVFERENDLDPWRLTLLDSFDSIMVKHIIRAYQWVEAVYGGSFETKRSIHE